VLAIFERGQSWRKETYLSPALKRFIGLDLLTLLNMVVKTNLLISAVTDEPRPCLEVQLVQPGFGRYVLKPAVAQVAIQALLSGIALLPLMRFSTVHEEMSRSPSLSKSKNPTPPPMVSMRNRSGDSPAERLPSYDSLFSDIRKDFIGS
jgi:hypothetical protein